MILESLLSMARLAVADKSIHDLNNDSFLTCLMIVTMWSISQSEPCLCVHKPGFSMGFFLMTFFS